MTFFTVNTKSAEVAQIIYERFRTKPVIYGRARQNYTISHTEYKKSVDLFKHVVTECLNKHLEFDSYIALYTDTHVFEFSVVNQQFKTKEQKKNK